MEANRIGRLEQVRRWIRSLDQRPGVYLIENTANGACYVGCAKKSLRQRLENELSELVGERHHVLLLQEDWRRFGCDTFVWWATYAPSAAQALETERWLTKLSLAFEDFGGYTLRTNENCVSASFRDTERKLAERGVRRYRYLDDANRQARISKIVVETFCQGDVPLSKTKQRRLDLNESERQQQLAEWKQEAHRSSRVVHESDNRDHLTPTRNT